MFVLSQCGPGTAGTRGTPNARQRCRSPASAVGARQCSSATSPPTAVIRAATAVTSRRNSTRNRKGGSWRRGGTLPFATLPCSSGPWMSTRAVHGPNPCAASFIQHQRAEPAQHSSGSSRLPDVTVWSSRESVRTHLHICAEAIRTADRLLPPFVLATLNVQMMLGLMAMPVSQGDLPTLRQTPTWRSEGAVGKGPARLAPR
jgi:hypothetical protein